MFDQKAFDAGRKEVRGEVAKPKEDHRQTIDEDFPVEETPYGDKISVTLLFEPTDLKALSRSSFNLALVNDSNYFLAFSLLIRDDGQKAWKVAYNGQAAPNEAVDVAQYTQHNISEVERIVFQAIAYKKSGAFQVKTPLNISKKIDTVKFFKAHCFRPGLYSDTPVIEIPLFSER